MDVKIPDIGDFKDVPVVTILVSVGDEVKAEDPLLELESDKATMEVPSPAAGKVAEIKVKEGDRERLQAYEGVCIARGGSGINESFTVRKISFGEGVERVFPIYSPLVQNIEVVRRGKVRRAKLYYLRERRGKSARIAEKVDYRSKSNAE